MPGADQEGEARKFYSLLYSQFSWKNTMQDHSDKHQRRS